MSTHVFLFGPPRIAHGGSMAALVFDRRHQMLAYLALRRGGAQRAELAALLWPDGPPNQAHANLRKALFRLRELPWAPAVAVRDQLLAFDGNSDVADFESAIAQQRWADALRIADQPLLAGFDDDASERWSNWLRAERTRLRAAWRAAALHRLAATNDPAEALMLSSRLLAHDPLDEAALRAHMLAHAQQGHPDRARNAYRAYADQLARDLDAAPSAELHALHNDLGASPATATAPAADGAAHLIGRSVERRTVRERLEANCRLVCLIGPGGVGKSSLAQQLMADLAVHYPEGSAFVPLDDVPSPDALGARLARELAVPLAGGDPLQAVIAFLRGRRMLLALDNFEHLRDAAPQLQTLLQACPRVQLLVTSRVRLGLAGEQLVPLDGLPCPAPDDADCLDSFDAVRLFVRAAQAVDPSLRPAAEAAAIIDICRLVDGLPLALQIAAGWTRVLPCSAIAAELRRGIDLLLEADTARPARHASMAAVFEQSWRLLGPVERSTWARMTVFHGSFTPEAARAVTAATLPMLAAFVDQSLLRKTDRRVDLHPLLRQLVAPHLTGDERDAAHTAHATHYLRWVGTLMEDLRRGDKQALQHVDVEFENVRAAWCWACRHGRADALQGAVLPLMRFGDLNGRTQEVLALMREAAQAAAGSSDARLAPLLDAATAHFAMRREHHAEAQALAERALLATRETRDHDTRLICFKTLGTCALETGRLPIARRRYRQALALAAPDPYHTAAVMQNLALVEKDLGHYEAARLLLIRAGAEYRSMGNAAGDAWGLCNLAAVEMDAGQFDTAAAHLDASLALSERHALAIIKMLALLNLTDLAVRRNDAAAAQHHGQRALELASQIGARGEQMLAQLHLAQLGVQQGDLATARAMLSAAVENAVSLDHPPTQLDCVLCFANLLHVQGELDVALGLLRYATGHPATAKAARERARNRLAEWSRSRPEADAPPAPAIDLWTLLHRIVAETPAGHASLIGSLQTP